MNKIIITKLNDIPFLFVYEDDDLVECHPLSGGSALQIGSIYIGRVEKVVKNIHSAFIRLDKEHVGYLPLNDKPALILNRTLPKGLTSIAENDLVLVQVETEPQKLKQAKVTGNISLGGRYVALDLNSGKNGISKRIIDNVRTAELKTLLDNLLLHNEKNSLLTHDIVCNQYGIVLRTACEQASDGDIVAEFETLFDSMERIVRKAAYEKKTGCIYEGVKEYQSILEDYGLNRIDEVKTDIAEVYKELSGLGIFEQTNDRYKKMEGKDNAPDKHFKGILTLYKDKDYPLYKLMSLETEVGRLLNKKVWLKSGGFLIIEQTEAMVVIDVNSGKSIKKKKMETHIFETNMEAAKEITRQLRLRNLSGIIMVDFINMDNEEYKERLVKCLKSGFYKDKVPASFVDITKLDVFELTRKKVRRPLHEVIYIKNDEICLR